MILERFAHHGSIAFLDPITLPFGDLPPILGVCGPTGAGKTTLFELLCAARHGETAYRDIPLHQQFERPGKIETEFTVAGERYRSVLTIDPRANRTEGMLYSGNRHLAGPLIRDFRLEAVRRFGPMDLFLCTAYAVQPKSHGRDTSGSFLRADRADRRAIFSEMFGLKSFERYRAISKDKADTLMAHVKELRARVAELDDQITKRAALEEQHSQLATRLAEAEASLATNEAAAKTAHTTSTEASNAVTAIEALQPEAKQLKLDLASLGERIRDTEERLRNNRALLARTGEIRRAVKRDADLNEERGTLMALKPEADALGQDLVDLEQKIRQTEARLDVNLALLHLEPQIRNAVATDRALEREQAELEPLQATKNKIASGTEAIQQRLAGLRTRHQEQTALLARKDEIASAVNRLHIVDDRLLELDAAIDAATNALRAAGSAYHAASMTRGRRAELMREAGRLREAAAIVTTVPCRGEGDFAGCRFLLNAQGALHTLVDVEHEITELDTTLAEAPADEPQEHTGPLRCERDELRTERQRLLAVAALHGLLAQTQALITGLDEQLVGAERELGEALTARKEAETGQSRLAQINAERTTLAALAARVGALEVASALTADLRGALTDLALQGTTMKARRDHLLSQLPRIDLIDQERRSLTNLLRLSAPLEMAQGRIQDLTATLTSATREHQAKSSRLIVITAEIAKLPDLEHVRIKYQQLTNEAEEHRRMSAQSVTWLTREIGIVDGQLGTIAAAEHRAQEAQQELEPLVDDMGDWSLLARAFAPAGIPALLVDVELPDIGQIATDLLRECYGDSLFTISLTTQKLASDESKLLETLDVLITRENKPIEASLLSGGEGALLSESLSLALALSNARRSSHPISTIMRDEVSAPLDVIYDGRAMGYTRMLRRVAQLGHFRHALFVSHQAECLALADARLEVKGGRITVV